MNFIKQKLARWLLGRAIEVGELEAEKAAAAVPQSKRTTFLGIFYFIVLLARMGIAAFDGDPTTHVDFDMIDILLFGGGFHAVVTREQRAHDEEKKLKNGGSK